MQLSKQKSCTAYRAGRDEGFGFSPPTLHLHVFVAPCLLLKRASFTRPTFLPSPHQSEEQAANPSRRLGEAEVTRPFSVPAARGSFLPACDNPHHHVRARLSRRDVAHLPSVFVVVDRHWGSTGCPRSASAISAGAPTLPTPKPGLVQLSVRHLGEHPCSAHQSPGRWRFTRALGHREDARSLGSHWLQP